MSYCRILGIFFRYCYVARKGLHHFSDIFYWPFIDILLWGLASIWMQSRGLNTKSLSLSLMTALILWQISWRGSVDISMSLLQEFWQRNLINLFSTPLKLSEWIVGVLMLSICKLIITVVFGSLAIYMLYKINVFTIGWAFLPFAISLMVFGWSIGFIASAFIIYWGHAVEMIAWMIGGLFVPLSAVFYPLSSLPDWMQSISRCLPTTYVFEGMRFILDTKKFNLEFFIISILISFIFLLSSMFMFKLMFEKSRKKGLGRLE